ncbi:MAG: hypothetical protein J6O53_01540 [Eubacterium sp.]|nr:hypothetical protein [Eubacterium sp.]
MKIFKKINKLSLSVKIYLVIALICTVAIPVFAWFAYQDKIEAMTKIKKPPSINLASGGNDPALYITLENIDATKSERTEYVVFSVEPGKYSAYDLQLSHTTNIPFTYELYRVQEDENGEIEYTDHSTIDAETGLTVDPKLMYSIISTSSSETVVTNGKVNLSDINSMTDPSSSTDRKIGNENSLAENRKNYDTTDDVNKYVKPLYSIARKIPQLTGNIDGSDDRDYFAIKITWSTTTNLNEEDNGYWDYAFNNKETDIIYISAKENSID